MISGAEVLRAHGWFRSQKFRFAVDYADVPDSEGLSRLAESFPDKVNRIRAGSRALSEVAVIFLSPRRVVGIPTDGQRFDSER